MEKISWHQFKGIGDPLTSVLNFLNALMKRHAWKEIKFSL